MFRFPWGDMHSLNLGWFLQKFNELREDWATAEAGIDGALDAEIEKAEDALSDVFAARDAAAASATAAAGSASAAGTSATAAQNSATGAASSATLANQKATAAGLSEAAAAQSATQAAASETAAAGSATTASAAATNAAASETAAGQSATAAAGSATAAGNSATAAAASAAAAEAVEESIPQDYSALSTTVQELSVVYPQNIMSLYKTYCAPRKDIASQYITLNYNKIIVEKNNSTGVSWVAVPFMLPGSEPMPDTAYAQFLTSNINNFQKRWFNRIRVYGVTDKTSSDFGAGVLISRIVDGEIVSRTQNMNIPRSAGSVYVDLNADELAADVINVGVLIRSNENVTNNAVIIVNFENV